MIPRSSTRRCLPRPKRAALQRALTLRLLLRQPFALQALGTFFAELAKMQAKLGGAVKQQHAQRNASSVAPSLSSDDMVSNNVTSSDVFVVGREGIVGTLFCGSSAPTAAAVAPSFALTSTRLLWLSPSPAPSSSSPPQVHCLPLLSIGTLKQGAGDAACAPAYITSTFILMQTRCVSD